MALTQPISCGFCGYCDNPVLHSPVHLGASLPFQLINRHHLSELQPQYLLRISTIVYRSTDGFSYTVATGQLQAGLLTKGAIVPKTSFGSALPAKQFDVIVIGAGYCGLTAARDAAVAG